MEHEVNETTEGNVICEYCPFVLTVHIEMNGHEMLSSNVNERRKRVLSL